MVKYEEEVYEYLKGKRLTCAEICSGLGPSNTRVWYALTQLEQKKLVKCEDWNWSRTDEGIT